ncbi:MAG: methyltransferase [Rhodobacteraceae bacterium]|nr:methyltransferase [Paracoccaceae bacterium]
MFDEHDMTRDAFLGGRLTVLQPRRGYRAAADPVLLAAAVPAKPGEAVLELGCGAGVASLCLGHRVPGLMLSGLELQPAYADLARRNAKLNGQPFEVVEGDLATMPPALRLRAFDHVIANPPYFARGDGTAAWDDGREVAQRAETPLALWIEAGLRRLRPGGRFTMIQTAERLDELLAAFAGGAGSLVVLPVASRAGRAAVRVIVSARKGGRTPLRLLSPFILHAGARHERDGEDYAPAARAILRDGAALVPPLP